MTAKPSDFAWGPVFITAFGPSILFGIAQGTILPIFALSAIELGASYALSGFIAALIGIGVLFNNIPAALFTSRVGERLALIGASVFSVIGLLLCLFSQNLFVLGCGVLMQGMSTSVFNLARQAYILHIVPHSLRARAFSIMGGTQRIGVFVGPFLGAAAMYVLGLQGAYWVAVIAIVATGALCFMIPELPAKEKQENAPDAPDSEPNAATQERGVRQLWGILRDHYKIFLTLGFGVMCLGALRATRPIAVPLWSEYIGLSPTATAIIFGCSAAIDTLFFYPAGVIMDKFGRGWIAVPSVLLMGLAFLLMPLMHHTLPFVLMTLLLGLGNGIGAGIVMTLGADAAPDNQQLEFLGLWRVFADSGQSIGPLLMSLITAALSLSMGIFFIGSIGFVAAWIFGREFFGPKAKAA